MDKIRKRYKFFTTFGKEREWLENMALKGWMFQDIKLGCVYYFRQDKPKQMLYEMDRFDLKRNPTLEEMLEKKNFVEMAQETGWQEITHDESMNYYFAKEYQEGGFNELYNDEDSLQYRADKYRKRFTATGVLMIKLAVMVAVCGILPEVFSHYDTNERVEWSKILFQFFSEVYVIGTSLIALFYFRMANVWYGDMKGLTRENARKRKEANRHKQWRLILTSQGLRRYLKKHASQNEKLESMGMFSYTFVHTEQPGVDFGLDTKSMVDKRRQKLGKKKLKDAKDWNLMSNDWQAESIENAREQGLECLCAFDNRAIIYQAYDEKKIPEDMKKQKLRLFSILGGTGMLMLIGGCIGFIVGFISAWMGY
ncbi:MAG: DUF2812 domain-containing protein [Lachnospiraceae bacterium]|nr:DUF2812 domain-containing protein [Lachnospiraceae bacterium]